MASRQLFSAALLLGLIPILPAADPSVDIVEVWTINPVAGEHDPANNSGLIQFRRSGSSGALEVGFRVAGTAVPLADYLLQAGDSHGTTVGELATDLTGDDNDLVFQRKPSAGSADIVITYVDPGAANQRLSVSVAARAITVRLATNASSAITSTATQVASALAGNAQASALVSAVPAAGNSGSGQVTALSARTLSLGRYVVGFAPGSQSADVQVLAIDDNILETGELGLERVQIQVQPDEDGTTNYILGNHHSDVVVIGDDEVELSTRAINARATEYLSGFLNQITWGDVGNCQGILRFEFLTKTGLPFLEPYPPQLTTSLAGDNNDLTFTAYGFFTISYVQPQTPPAEVGVLVKGSAITVLIRPGTTANEVMAAIQADAEASRLLQVSLAPGNDGTGLVEVMEPTDMDLPAGVQAPGNLFLDLEVQNLPGLPVAQADDYTLSFIYLTPDLVPDLKPGEKYYDRSPFLDVAWRARTTVAYRWVSGSLVQLDPPKTGDSSVLFNLIQHPGDPPTPEPRPGQVFTFETTSQGNCRHLYTIIDVSLTSTAPPTDPLEPDQRLYDSNGLPKAYYKVIFYPSLPTDLAAETPFSNRIILGTQGPGALYQIGVLPGYQGIDLFVSPKDDLRAEGSEAVSMRFLDTPHYVIREPNSTTVTLADDDVVVDISRVNDASEPAFAGKALVRLSQPLPHDVTVNLFVDTVGLPDRAIEAPEDFTADKLADPAQQNRYDFLYLPRSIIIPAGRTSIEIPVMPLPDTIDEGVEQLRLRLLPSDEFRLAGTGDAGKQPDVVINLLDSIGTLDFQAPATTTFAEGGNSLTLTFPLARNTGQADKNLTFGLTFTGKATASDFTVDSAEPGTVWAVDPSDPQRGLVTILAGHNRARIILTAVDDQIYEGDEGLDVTLEAGAGYVLATGAGLPRSLTVLDNEPTVTVTAVAEAIEGGQRGIFRFSFNGPAVPQDTTIPVSFTGTASAADYQPLPATVVIASGNTSYDLLVSATDDGLADDNETLIITLAAGAGYRLAGTTATLRLRDPQVVPTDVPMIRSEMPQGQMTAGEVLSTTLLATRINLPVSQIRASIRATDGTSPMPTWISVTNPGTQQDGFARFALRVAPPASMPATHLRFQVLVEYDRSGDGQFAGGSVTQDITLFIIAATPTGAG